mgnify:FL=1
MASSDWKRPARPKRSGRRRCWREGPGEAGVTSERCVVVTCAATPGRRPMAAQAFAVSEGEGRAWRKRCVQARSDRRRSGHKRERMVKSWKRERRDERRETNLIHNKIVSLSLLIAQSVFHGRPVLVSRRVRCACFMLICASWRSEGEQVRPRRPRRPGRRLPYISFCAFPRQLSLIALRPLQIWISAFWRGIPTQGYACMRFLEYA